MLRSLAALAALSSAATAAGYDDNPILVAFRDHPCTTVIEAIDNPDTAAAANAPDLGSALRYSTGRVSHMAAYFGFIVGFDTANGGLRGDAETTLMRLRDACREHPDTPALDLLRSF